MVIVSATAVLVMLFALIMLAQGNVSRTASFSIDRILTKADSVL